MQTQWAGTMLNSSDSWSAAWRQNLDSQCGSMETHSESSCVHVSVNGSWLHVEPLRCLPLCYTSLSSQLQEASLAWVQQQVKVQALDTEYLGFCMILPLSKSDIPEMECSNTRADSVESTLCSAVVLPFFSITQSIPSCPVILNNGRMTALAEFTHRHVHEFILSGLGNLDIDSNDICWCKLKTKQTFSEMLYSPSKCWMIQYYFLKKIMWVALTQAKTQNKAFFATVKHLLISLHS